MESAVPITMTMTPNTMTTQATRRSLEYQWPLPPRVSRRYAAVGRMKAMGVAIRHPVNPSTTPRSSVVSPTARLPVTREMVRKT
jgi:hypothetical protein